MTRPLRINVPDGVYHVTSRGLERRAIVQSDGDRHRWVHLLGTVSQRRRWRVLAWVLLDNHFHLFVRTPDGDLSDGMHDLNSGYVSVFNRVYERHGPLFQGRFKGIFVEREHHYWELTRYVHLNPVRAGIVRHPQDYTWSSCPAYFDTRIAPAWLAWQEVLAEHGDQLEAARGSYLTFLEDGMRDAPTSPLKKVVASTVLGGKAFVERVKHRVSERLPDPEIPAARALRDAPQIEAIEAAVCQAFEVPPDLLHARGAHGNDARAVAVYLCRKLTTISLSELGNRFGGVTPAAVSQTHTKMAQRLERNATLKEEADRIAATLGVRS